MLNAPRACLCKGPKPALHDATCTSLDWGRLENLMTKEDYKKTVPEDESGRNASVTALPTKLKSVSFWAYAWSR